MKCRFPTVNRELASVTKTWGGFAEWGRAFLLCPGGFRYRGDAHGIETPTAPQGDEGGGTQSGEKERGGSWEGGCFP